MTSYSGDRVKSSIKRWLIRWAEDHGDQVIALVAFGSDGLGDQSASSDLDLCYILCDENLCQSFAETLLSTIRREFSSGLVSVVEDRKLLMLLPEGNFVTKVDCYVAHDLSSIERLIVGSELPSNRLENGILLYENQMYSARVKAYLQVILTKEPPTNDIAAAIIKQRLSFINAFETASHKRSISDKYQFYFQLFLCHIYLVKLEYIRQGGRHFVYMPKMAYNSFPNEVRRHFEDELETRGRLDLSSEVLSKYLAQFLNTLTALLEQFPGAVDDHLSTQRIENVLSTVLERDRFYNFRDAGQGAIPHSLLFRSAFYKIGEIVQKYQVRTVLDLRTDKERSQNPLVLPQQVTHLEIDIFSCSTAEMLGSQVDTDHCLSHYNWYVGVGKPALGLVLRTLSRVSLPLLVHCVAGRDRTGVVIALIQYICGATHEQIVSDYLMSHQGTNANDIQEVLDTVYRNPSLFFASCGLNDEVISSLRNQFSTATNCEHAVLPDILISKRRYRFISGEPTCPCRPFLADELQAMKQFMMHSVPGGQLHPTLVVVTGLPGGGKSALGDSILLQLGIDPKHCVDIDMDIVRCFHTQLQLMRNRSAASSESNQNDVLLSYDELLPWFMRGASNMETLLYADTNGVVQTALQCRCHIFLPCVISNRQTLSFIKDCVALYGYRICLVGVHSSLERAVQRAATRGYLTGRFTPSVYIENCCQSVRENFIDATRFVNSCDGTIMLYDNETDKETNSHLLPKLCFFSCRGEIKLVDERVSSMYELPTVLQDKCAAQNDIIVRSPQLPTAEESSNEEFNFYTDGFVLLGNCVDPNIVRAMGDRFESQIAQFASNNEVTMQEYLSVINKWSHCNSVVMDIMMEISNLLRRKVAEILNSAVAWPVGAVLFRKSSITDEASCVPTHAHQDIAYARFPGSQMFRVTTWVPLVLNNSDTLAFTRGSHKMEVSPVADFLSTASNVEATTQQCDTAVPVQYGDAILFDARVWHRSTAFPPADSVETSSSGLRLAVGIQWLTPGGLDGLKQGAYFRWPESDVPATVDVMALRRKGIFGVDTAGWFLKCALLAVKEEIDAIRGESVHSVPSEYRSSSDRNQKKKDRYLRFVDPDNPHVCELQLFSTLSMAAEICNEANAVAVDVLRKLKCSPSEAQSALKRYVLFRKASRRDFGEAQGAKVFGPLHNYFINPILFAED